MLPHLFTGKTLRLEPVNPFIILSLPLKLVVEVRATGAYQYIIWARNGFRFGAGNFFPLFEDFSHFNEVYAITPTTSVDYGVYRVDLMIRNEEGVATVADTATVTVIPFGKCKAITGIVYLGE